MFGTRDSRARIISVLALGGLVLGACGGSPVDSYADAEENWFIGCLDPIDGQVAQFEDGVLEDPDQYDDLDQCDWMWKEISGTPRGETPTGDSGDSGDSSETEPQGLVPFADFSLVNDAIEEEPDLLMLDVVPTGLVDEEDQARLDETVAVLQEIAADASLLGTT